MARNELSIFKNFDPFELIEKELDDLWFYPLFKYSGSSKYAPLDISEDDKNYFIEADLPGFTKDQISVKIDKDILTISASNEKEEEKQTKKYHKKERVSKSCTRSISIPENVDVSNISAKFENGVLTLTLPKKEPEKTNQIEIKVE
ncbi:MAG TPA: Hsp20/alpha crystallin family protein [Exilispira sp.]|nr:Hsp20/alpha crystallin family protein [Exilispira sp.]